MLPSYEPMLATKWPVAFDDEAWWYEVKWDGYRALLGNDGRVNARSRRGIDLVDPFPELATLPIPEGVVLDGEIVAFDEDGRPSFDLIQKRTGFGGSGTMSRVAVNFVAFDVLFSGGLELIDLGLEQRRDVLDELDLPSPIVTPTPTVGSGIALFDAVQDQGMEGIVAKRKGSRYLPGRRSADWRKVSVRRQMRAIVGGWAEGEGGRASTFGSLLLGLWDGDQLRFVGAVGSGFRDETLRAIFEALHQIERTSPAFDPQIQYPGKLHWVEPGIVVNVEYKEWTADGHLRAPVFKGVEIAEAAAVDWASEGPDAVS